MPVELITIDRVPTIFPGQTDPVERFVSHTLSSEMDIKMLRIDQRIRVGIPVRNPRRSLPVFAECRNDGEFPKLMAAAEPGYRYGWASGVLKVNHAMLQSAEFWFPDISDRRLSEFIHRVYDQIASVLVIPPHHQILVNRRLRFGFMPDRGTLEQYYPSD